MCVWVWGGGGGGGEGGGGEPGLDSKCALFFIPQRALKVPFLIIQRALEVPFFIKLPCPFFVPKVYTIAGCTIAILVLLWTTIAITIVILL